MKVLLVTNTIHIWKRYSSFTWRQMEGIVNFIWELGKIYVYSRFRRECDNYANRQYEDIVL